MERRPVDQEKAKWRQVQHLRNRRDTLVHNIVKFGRAGNLEAVQLNRQEANRVNQDLMALQA